MGTSARRPHQSRPAGGAADVPGDVARGRPGGPEASSHHRRRDGCSSGGIARGGSSGSSSAAVLRRRDSGGSGGSSGTNFLTNNNVIVKGRCSPTTNNKKEEQGTEGTKLDDGVAAPPAHAPGDSVHSAECALTSCACGGDEVEHRRRASLGSACTDRAVDASELFGIDTMDEDEEGCWDHDDDLSTAREYFLAETLGVGQQREGLVSGHRVDHVMGSLRDGCGGNRSRQQQPQASWSGAPSSQHIVGNNLSHILSLASSAFRRHPSPPFAPSCSRSPPPPASASPDTNALLRSMHHILNLNQSAIDHTLAGGDAAWALDALHKAEWIRCHLADELAVMQSIQYNRENQKASSHHGHVAEAGDRRLAFCNFKTHPAGLSNSAGSIAAYAAASSSSSLEQPRKKKYPRRSSSFSDDRQQDEQQATHPILTSPLRDPLGDNVSPSSYIYQRMDFDEGMHSFADLEAIDPSAFWLPVDNGFVRHHVNDKGVAEAAPLLYEMSPVVEATLVFNVGQVHRRRGDLDAASKCYDRALHVLRSRSCAAHHHRHGEVHPLLIPLLHNVGQLRYRRGDVRLAMETYASALVHARGMYGGRHPHVASALNCLGVLHYHDANVGEGAEEEAEMGGVAANASNSGNANGGGSGSSGNSSDENQSQQQQQQQQHSSTQKAMDLFQQALSIRVEALGPHHVDVATSLNNIGRIHVQLDEFDQALGYYEDALRIRRAALGVDSLDYAATAFNAGQSFHQKGDLERAAELYHEFLRVALARFGHGHRDVAVVLSGIAQIHQEKREHDKALELYEASLCAGRAALGEDHSEIAMLLNRMGNFHFERERLDDALRCYKRGLRIERRVLPPDHPNIVVTLSNLGEIHRQRGEWDEAAKMYGDCLDILREKHDGADHADVASTLSTIGLIHDQRGDTCLSLHYLQDALLMRRRLVGNDHLDVSATLVYVGTILYRKGVFSVAMELFAESLRIRRAALGDGHRDVAFVLYNIALVHQQRGCYEEAIESYTETLRIERMVLGENHRDVSMTLFKLGEVNKAAGDLEEALKCFKESLAVERSLSTPSSSANTIDVSTTTAADASGQGQEQRPQPPTAAGGPDHAAMARALNEIGNIHLARGDVVPMMDALNEASRMYRAAGLSPHNVVVSGALYALEFSCPEAAPAA